jgi:prevent-host-death family protein
MTQYSIAQARDQLARLIHNVEKGETAELTRRGQRVAVILSAEAYDRLQNKKNVWEAVQEFRAKHGVDNWEEDLDIDAIFDVRDKSPGREVSLW